VGTKQAGATTIQPTNSYAATSGNVDWFIFLTSAVLILAVCVPLVLYPEGGKAALDAGFEYVTQELGVLYVVSASAALLVLLVLAFGRHGDTRLGPPDSQPEFSPLSWAAMASFIPI